MEDEIDEGLKRFSILINKNLTILKELQKRFNDSFREILKK